MSNDGSLGHAVQFWRDICVNQRDDLRRFFRASSYGSKDLRLTIEPVSDIFINLRVGISDRWAMTRKDYRKVW
jgi:hypothetical protein